MFLSEALDESSLNVLQEWTAVVRDMTCMRGKCRSPGVAGAMISKRGWAGTAAHLICQNAVHWETGQTDPRPRGVRVDVGREIHYNIHPV